MYLSKLQKEFVQFAKKYLSKLLNVFVKISKCICMIFKSRQFVSRWVYWHNAASATPVSLASVWLINWFDMGAYTPVSTTSLFFDGIVKRECVSQIHGSTYRHSPVCDGTQNVKRYQYRYFFFRYQIFPIPVPILFSGTKFFRYRYRYFFPVPNFSDTGSDTTKKNENSRYREFPVPVSHTLADTPGYTFWWSWQWYHWPLWWWCWWQFWLWWCCWQFWLWWWWWQFWTWWWWCH